MIYGTIEVADLGWDSAWCCALSYAIGLIGVLAAWIDSADDSERKAETKERLSSAARVFTELVALIAKRRNEAKEEETLLRDVLKLSGTEIVSAGSPNGVETDDEPSDSEVRETTSKSPRVSLHYGSEKINYVDFWREDYWNFENSRKGDLFASDADDEDESEPWKRSLDNYGDDEENEDESEGQSERWNDREESQEEESERLEQEDRKRRARFFGPFFNERNYPMVEDESEEEGESESSDEPKRWRRKDRDEKEKAAARDVKPVEEISESPISASESEEEKSSETKSELDSAKQERKEPKSNAEEIAEYLEELRAQDEEANDYLNGIVELIEAQEEDEDAIEDEPEDDGWGSGMNVEYIENPKVPEEKKIAYLRKLLKGGNEEARETLVRFHVVFAAVAKAEDAPEVVARLDEAEKLLDEAPENDWSTSESGKLELRAHVLLQRPIFYLRNGLLPQMKEVKRALDKVREITENSPDRDMQRILATAWQIYGECLAASGADSAALPSLQRALELFEDLVDSGMTDAEPSVGFVSTAIGEVYLSVGDARLALEAYEKSLSTFSKDIGQEGFSAEYVNTLFRMSLTRRRLGEDKLADDLLRQAIRMEERLLSYDETSYFAPMTQLLQIQADVFAQRDANEDALASLDRAASILERFLASDSLLPRRVLAYAHLENTLRRRAAIYVMQKRYELAARDICQALDTLTLATKKDDDFNPTIQATLSGCLVFDMSVMNESWENAGKIRVGLRDLFKTLSPLERKRIAPLYARLLLQRRSFLARAGKFKDAIATSNEAVGLLEQACKEDDSQIETQVHLAKALIQRGAIRDNGKGKTVVSLNDLRRAKTLMVQGVDEGALNNADEMLLVEMLMQKSQVEAKSGNLEAARDDVRVAIQTTLAGIRRQRWNYLDPLASLSRMTIRMAVVLFGAKEALRVAHLWLRYAKRLRVFYVEKGWTSDGEESESSESLAVLQGIEAFIVDVRRLRAEILEATDWSPEFEKYCDMNFSSRLTQAPTEEDSEEETDAPTRRLVESCRLTVDAKRRESRARFVRERLADEPKIRAYFSDIDLCKRVVERRVATGEFAMADVFFHLLDKTTDLMIDKGELALAVAETREAVQIFDNFKEEVQKRERSKRDEYWLHGFSFWELLATLSGRLYNELHAEVQDEPTTSAPTNALRNACLNELRAEAKRAFLQAVVATKHLPISDPTTTVRIGAATASYVAWLFQNGRDEEGAEFARDEGKALEERCKNKAPLELLAVSIYYDSIATVARDFNKTEFAREIYGKAKSALDEEARALGKAAIVSERYGLLYDNLAKLYAKDGKIEEAREHSTKAVEYFCEAIKRNCIAAVSFDVYAQLVEKHFVSDFPEDRRLASKHYHEIARRFDGWSRSACAERCGSFWRLNVAALAYYDRRRNAFHSGKQVVERMRKLVGLFERRSTAHELRLVEWRFLTANFWSRYGAWKESDAQIVAALETLRAQFDAVAKDETLRAAGLSDELLIQIRRYMLIAYMMRAQTLLLFNPELWSKAESGDMSIVHSARELVAKAFEMAQGLPEIAEKLSQPEEEEEEPRSVATFCKYWAQAYVENIKKIWKKWTTPRVLAQTPGLAETLDTSEFDDLEENSADDGATELDNQMLFMYSLLRVYSAALDGLEFGAEKGASAFSEILADVRAAHGKNSSVEAHCLYSWACMQLKQKRWKDALHAAQRSLGYFTGASLKSHGEFNEEITPWLLDGFRICAQARLNRRQVLDVFWARREFSFAMKSCRSALESKYFIMRSIYLDLLLSEAKLARIDGKLEDALAIATRAKNLAARATRRGVAPPSMGTLEELTALCATLTDELAKKNTAHEPTDGNSVENENDGGATK